MEKSAPPAEGPAQVHGLPASLSVNLSRFGEYAIRWMTRAEVLHESRMFYSNEVEIGVGKLVGKPSEAMHGKAKGFVAKSKSFTLAEGIPPHQAIQDFIGGDVTICECEGLMHAVMYNALREVLGDALFDRVFSVTRAGTGGLLPIGSKDFETVMKDPTTGKSILPSEKPRNEYQPGDWVYIFTSATREFHEAVQETGRGGAAGGWNLICCGEGKFMGFGLSQHTGQAYTLDEIREKMVSDLFDAGEPPKKEAAPPLVHARRGSGDFSSRAASFAVATPPSSSRPIYKSAKNRAVIKNSIKVTFFRRLDVNVLAAWIASLSH